MRKTSWIPQPNAVIFVWTFYFRYNCRDLLSKRRILSMNFGISFHFFFFCADITPTSRPTGNRQQKHIWVSVAHEYQCTSAFNAPQPPPLLQPTRRQTNTRRHSTRRHNTHTHTCTHNIPAYESHGAQPNANGGLNGET